MDVPYSSVLDRRIPFTGRQALPETAGVYAWWVRDDITRADANPEGPGARPLYLGAATNIAGSATADAAGVKVSALRRGLATVMAERVGLRPRTSAQRRPLNKGEHERMNHWISTHLLVSWSELPHPAEYRNALVRALNPHLKP